MDLLVSDVVIVANPKAGGGADLMALRDAVRGWSEVEIRLTEAAGDGCRIAREAARGGARVVVAAGGDGTVHEVVAGLVAADAGATLGIVPLGTGNDLVRSLGLPIGIPEAVQVVRGGRTRRIDLIRVEVDPENAGDSGGDAAAAQTLVNAAAGGFSGQVHDALDSEVKRVWGPLSYLRSAVEAMGDTEPWSVKVTIDDREDRLDVLNVVVANGRFAGSGIPIAPHADPFDGLLDLAIVRAAPMLRLSRMAPKLLRGEDPGDEHFVTSRGREVRLEADRPMPFSLDGERVEITRARFRLLRGALEVIVLRVE